MGFYQKAYPGRDEAMAHAYRSGHYTLQAVGDYVGVSYATVSRPVKSLEENMWNVGPDPVTFRYLCLCNIDKWIENTLPNYSYTCPVCNSIVSEGLDVCKICGCPAITTQKELNWLKETWHAKDNGKPIDNLNNPYHSHVYTKSDIWKIISFFLFTSALIYTITLFFLSKTFSPHSIIGDEIAINILRIILIVALMTPALLTFIFIRKIKNMHNKRINKDNLDVM